MTKQLNKRFVLQEVRMVTRDRIDAQKWNTCVSNSVNESPLAYTWVLDYLAPGWEGLIIKDYEGVMPLPVSKNMGLRLLQMPPEVLTLGIFSHSQEIIQLFPSILYHPSFKKFRFISYNGSPFHIKKQTFPGVATRHTFELDLNQSYNNLYRGYSRNHKRNIRDFHKKGIQIKTHGHSNAFPYLMTEIGAIRPELFTPDQYLSRFEQMLKTALRDTQSTSYSVWYRGRLIGASFFLSVKKRTIPYHLSNEQGRIFKTSFALIDHYIKENAEKEIILDFYGSTLPHIAEFNRKFGAVAVPYESMVIDRLPLPLSIAKKKNILFRLKRFF